MTQTTQTSPETSLAPSAIVGHAFAVVALAVGLWLSPMRPAAAASPTEAFAAHTKGSTATVDHSAWDALLKAYVVAGSDGVNRVAYARFKREAHPRLEAYIQALAAVDVKALDRPEQFAFWANLYNAKTVDIVLDKYPVASIKDISLGGGLFASLSGGPWKAKVVEIGGVELSLDDIEHAILRPIYKDARIHYAVNCASYGCPNLGTEAFSATRLSEQLDAAARAYVNHPRGIAVKNGSATASSIYSWYQVDFGGTAAGVIAHMKRFAGEALKPKLESITGIDDYGYDWSLNDAKN
ncbi:MAG: DUF547 domain-containing protein [Hyphomicrobium sp.]